MEKPVEGPRAVLELPGGLAVAGTALAAAREAFAAREWAAAFERLGAVDADGGLGAPDLELLWLAGRMLGQTGRVNLIQERAHQAWLEDGQPDRAARCAFWLGMALMHDGEPARSNAWFTRAGSILDDHGLDTVERGFLLVPAGLQAFYGGDPSTAEERFAAAHDYGIRAGDRDLLALSRLGLGQSAIALGRTAEGVGRLDEAMLGVTSGETSPTVTGIVYCGVIAECMAICDLTRAEEWTRALTAWCEDQPELVPFRGQCLIHRAELLQVHGRWNDAADRATRAHGLLEEARDPAIGDSWYLQAELARVRGDTRTAEASYRQAAQHGREPQPGMALLKLSEGDIERAAAASRRVVNDPGGSLDRLRILAAHVEIMLAADDLPAAQGTVAKLRALAADVDAPMLQATTSAADGAVRLAAGDAPAAHQLLRDALSTWIGLQLPFEAARTRVQLGRACHALGDLDAAELEWETARAAFEDLGAVPSLEALDATVAELVEQSPTPDPAGGLTGRELEVLAHVATGMTNREIAEALVISEKTVSRHLSNMFTKLGVSSRAAATAYAFTHDLV